MVDQVGEVSSNSRLASASTPPGHRAGPGAMPPEPNQPSSAQGSSMIAAWFLETDHFDLFANVSTGQRGRRGSWKTNPESPPKCRETAEATPGRHFGPAALKYKCREPRRTRTFARTSNQPREQSPERL